MTQTWANVRANEDDGKCEKKTAMAKAPRNESANCSWGRRSLGSHWIIARTTN